MFFCAHRTANREEKPLMHLHGRTGLHKVLTTIDINVEVVSIYLQADLFFMLGLLSKTIKGISSVECPGKIKRTQKE